MMWVIKRWLTRAEAVISNASMRDARAIASLHAASFQRGWTDGEVEQLLIATNVFADRALIGTTLVGFILTRAAAGEAEILSIAVAKGARGRGIGRRMLQRNLQRLTGAGVGAVFLEVDAQNRPALALYRRMGFAEVGRREGYYRQAPDQASTALVLRRDL